MTILLLAEAMLFAVPRTMTFSCSRDNDLYVALGGRHKRFDRAGDAVKAARQGSAVLFLADGYPSKQTVVGPEVYEQARRKNLRLYVEYPAVGEPRTAEWARGVVASDVFGPALAGMRILGLHEVRFVPAQAQAPHLVLARVAGFDTAVYGLPAETHPILYEQDGVLIATTALSHFVRARFAPSDAWPVIWKWVLQRLTGDAPKLNVTPVVHPAYARDAVLPADAGRQAFRRGIDWFAKARLLLDRSWMDRFADVEKHKKIDGVLPAATSGLGDGSQGVLEGLNSRIAPDGTQPVRWWLRADCIGEVSGSYGVSCALLRNAEHCRIAERLNDFLYTRSELGTGPRADPASDSYGLLGWGWPGSTHVYYGDDNARAVLGTMLAAATVPSSKWDERILRTILGNFRTTGKLGFRRSRLEEEPLRKKGWRAHFEAEPTNFAPHYEAYMWALYLWAYDKTGYEPFRARAKSAIRMTMDAYPAKWRWTNGIQQERARMLLPLAWLVRIEDTAEHREWLRRVAADLLALQDASGAIREEVGSAGQGQYNPPRSNAEYGTTEAPLIQSNGDKLTDLLYTSNFAFLGLHEAAAATGDARYIEASNRLAQYLCRIQARSAKLEQFDGAWFRAFDFGRWEYWASNADAGWGAWSVETGWTQAWVTSVLGLRELKTSVWDITKSSQVVRHRALIQTMLR